MNAIEFNNISKQYRLGQISTGTISHDLNRWWARFRGKEDPYLRVGEVNDRSKKGVSDYVWALRDIDFSVEQGDVVGIIGKNGAGKSTLLKILSKITAPTTGEIRARGRIASLLEVGTGFHPEMTGRENIYMNGAIMGMTRAEITRKMDEIVDFAGVERYLDTPVKRYSSGMMVRLGFAVAAHLEPEILVVDEVLAVGDAEFQKKAIGKMQEVSRGDGRTVLFVSHNMDSILSLCNKGVLLHNGTISNVGEVDVVVSEYLSENVSNGVYKSSTSNKSISISDIYVVNNNGARQGYVNFGDAPEIRISVCRNAGAEIDSRIILDMALLDRFKNKVFTIEYPLGEKMQSRSISLRTTLPKRLIAPGQYSWNAALHVPNIELFEEVKDVCGFTITDDNSLYLKYNGVFQGNVVIEPQWGYEE